MANSSRAGRHKMGAQQSRQQQLLAGWSLADAAALQQKLPGSEHDALLQVRKRALAAVTGRPWPDRKSEYWRYTSLQALSSGRYRPVEAGEGPMVQEALLADSWRLVVVNGRLRRDLSTLPREKGIDILSLSDLAGAAPEDAAALLGDWPEQFDDGFFAAFNAAFAADGLLLTLADGCRAERPLEVVFLSSGDGAAIFPRLHVRLGRGSALRLIERHEGAGRYWSDGVASFDLDGNARLEHVRVLCDDEDAVNIATAALHIGADACYDGFLLSLGGMMTHQQYKADLLGEGGECRLNGAYLGHGRQHHDCISDITHNVPATRSHQVFKGVLDDRAHGVFQGRIVVRPGAQQTDGHQLNKTLLLSDRAEIDTKPELEIYADDVKCSHGATAGELDKDALFYLRSRGLADGQARALLINAFIADALNEIGDEDLRDALNALVARALNRQRAGGE